MISSIERSNCISLRTGGKLEDVGVNGFHNTASLRFKLPLHCVKLLPDFMWALLRLKEGRATSPFELLSQIWMKAYEAHSAELQHICMCAAKDLAAASQRQKLNGLSAAEGSNDQ